MTTTRTSLTCILGYDHSLRMLSGGTLTVQNLRDLFAGGALLLCERERRYVLDGEADPGEAEAWYRNFLFAEKQEWLNGVIDAFHALLREVDEAGQVVWPSADGALMGEDFNAALKRRNLPPVEFMFPEFAPSQLQGLVQQQKLPYDVTVPVVQVY